MTGDIRRLRRLTAAFLLVVAVFMTSACQSDGKSSAAQPVQGQVVEAPKATTPSTASEASSDTKICGTPPCMRFVSRSATKTLADTVSAHPIISTVVLHAAGLILCGGILCIFAEGISLAYIGREADQAAKNHECLRVRILPDGHEWRLVDLAPSNQSPYCTD